MEILFLLAGLLVGALLAWLALKGKAAAATATLSSALLVEQEKTKSLAEQVREAKELWGQERARANELSNKIAASEAGNQHLQEKLLEHKKEVEGLQEKFSSHFKNLAQEIFEEKSKKFTDQNKTNLFDLLKPLGEKIGEFEKKVEDTHKDTISRNSALREQLEQLQKLNVQMTKEAENLTRALKGDTKTQGAWGEFILESILEKSGLEKGREYTVQESINTENGNLRPDVIIRLPGNKHVIIDSKVSLTAYSNFVNATEDTAKGLALKAHVLSVRQHMKGLAEKNYQNLVENGLDFIFMFIPVEPAYILAFQGEHNLYEEALDKRIVFVSPTLLIPSLQMIKNVWKQEYQNKYAIDIANKAGDLYEKFKGFTDDLLALGKQLDSSKKLYEESMKKLTSGSGNLVRKTEELKKLGAKTNKSIDAKLLNRADE